MVYTLQIFLYLDSLLFPYKLRQRNDLHICRNLGREGYYSGPLNTINFEWLALTVIIFFSSRMNHKRIIYCSACTAYAMLLVSQWVRRFPLCPKSSLHHAGFSLHIQMPLRDASFSLEIKRIWCQGLPSILDSTQYSLDNFFGGTVFHTWTVYA